MVDSTEQKDLYRLLGVPKTASAEELKKAYRAKALQWHPDKVEASMRSEAEEKFKDIKEAYEILTDATKRQLYDQYGPISLDPTFDPQMFQAPPLFQQHPSAFQQGFPPPGFPPSFAEPPQPTTFAQPQPQPVPRPTVYRSASSYMYSQPRRAATVPTQVPEFIPEIYGGYYPVPHPHPQAPQYYTPSSGTPTPYASTPIPAYWSGYSTPIPVYPNPPPPPPANFVSPGVIYMSSPMSPQSRYSSPLQSPQSRYSSPIQSPPGTYTQGGDYFTQDQARWAPANAPVQPGKPVLRRRESMPGFRRAPTRVGEDVSNEQYRRAANLRPQPQPQRPPPKRRTWLGTLFHNL